MKKLAWLKHKPILGLTPMDGWTDSPFRQICKDHGADLLFSEMIPAAGIIHFNKKKIEERRKKKAQEAGVRIADKKLEVSNKKLAQDSGRGFFNKLYFSEHERPFVMQIFGKRPDEMAEACRILNEIKRDKGKIREKRDENKIREIGEPDEININFGCPAKTAVKSGHGAALMDNPDLAAEIVERCVESSIIPITVKMRTGWHRDDEAVPFAQKMAQAGAQAIYLHGRTFKQKYSGLADWQKIAEVAQAVQIPVVGNGDINFENVSCQMSNVKCNGLAGVLIGRAARGNPWIFGREMANKKLVVSSKKLAQIDFKETILKHAELMFDLKGEHGIIEFRKHLLQYVSAFLGAAKLRQKLVRVETFDQIKQILNDLLSFD